MSEPMRARSALESFLQPKHLDNQRGEPGLIPGLIIEEQQNICLLQMIARNNDPLQLSNMATKYLEREYPLAPLQAASENDLTICATGPLEYWVIGQKPDALDALAKIQSQAEQSASIFDQSEGKLALRLTGAKAADVLTKGTALDLHGSALPAQGAAHTVIDHVPALLAWQTEADHYDLFVPRSYACSFMTWLCDAARDVGFIINKND